MEVAVFVLVMFLMKIYALDSTEEDTDTNPYNSFAPSTSNLQDIYTSTFNRNIYESTQNDDYFTVQMQTAEFQPGGSKTSSVTPKIHLTTKTVVSTDNHIMDETEPFQVIPMRPRQKGVLDVLFPATRVKSFKNVFDSFRRILSYTFRK